MQAVQLTLWLNDPDVVEHQCSRCGSQINVMPRLRQLEQRGAARVLADPRIARLPSRTRAFFERALPLLLTGDPVGITPLADETDYTPGGANRHVRHLLASGVLHAEPKRTGGTYHVYRLALNGLAQN